MASHGLALSSTALDRAPFPRLRRQLYLLPPVGGLSGSLVLGLSRFGT